MKTTCLQRKQILVLEKQTVAWKEHLVLYQEVLLLTCKAVSQANHRPFSRKYTNHISSFSPTLKLKQKHTRLQKKNKKTKPNPTEPPTNHPNPSNPKNYLSSFVSIE